MTSRSYFGKMNSILGSVVPLAMFLLCPGCLGGRFIFFFKVSFVKHLISYILYVILHNARIYFLAGTKKSMREAVKERDTNGHGQTNLWSISCNISCPQPVAEGQPHQVYHCVSQHRHLVGGLLQDYMIITGFSGKDD